jgi:hypothetical protein
MFTGPEPGGADVCLLAGGDARAKCGGRVRDDAGAGGRRAGRGTGLGLCGDGAGADRREPSVLTALRGSRRRVGNGYGYFWTSRF